MTTTFQPNTTSTPKSEAQPKPEQQIVYENDQERAERLRAEKLAKIVQDAVTAALDEREAKAAEEVKSKEPPKKDLLTELFGG